jgi:hypothetical protein
METWEWADNLEILLDHHSFLILTKHFAQTVRDFADRAITLNGMNDVGHQVLVAAGGVFYRAQRCLPL